MNPLKQLDRVLETPEFRGYSTKILDAGKDTQKALVVVRHAPGTEAGFERLKKDPERMDEFIEHQNRVRLLLGVLLAGHTTTPILVEGLPARGSDKMKMLLAANRFEDQHGELQPFGTRMIPVIPPLRIQQKLNAGQVSPTLRDKLNGSHRAAGQLVNQGRLDRVLGIEPSIEEIYKSHELIRLRYFPDDRAMRREMNRLRHAHVVTQVRERVATNHYGVMALGASHTGDKIPLRQYVGQYLEDRLAQEAPDTRVIVVEPNFLDRVVSA